MLPLVGWPFTRVSSTEPVRDTTGAHLSGALNRHLAPILPKVKQDQPLKASFFKN